MKRIIGIVSLLAGCGCAAWLYAAPRIRVDHAARSHDPSEMKLNQIGSHHVSKAILKNSIQTGLIRLEDGGRVKFWFISRHEQPGKGLTRFDFQDGQTAYLSGAFCCEVQLNRDVVRNKESLLDYIAEADGSAP